MHFYEIFKQAWYSALVCITNILNYIIMLGTELPHVVQARAEGPESPTQGNALGISAIHLAPCKGKSLLKKDIKNENKRRQETSTTMAVM